MEILLFKLNNKIYGIELKYCKEIELLKNITHIVYKSENFKYYIEGICNLRGEIITLINLKKLFQLNNSQFNEYLLIRLNIKKEKIGILIDEVIDIISIESSQIDYSKGHLSSDLLRYIKFTVLVNHNPVLILNPENL